MTVQAAINLVVIGCEMAVLRISVWQRDADLAARRNNLLPGLAIERDAIDFALRTGGTLRVAGNLHGVKAGCDRPGLQPVDKSHSLLLKSGLGAQLGRVDQNGQ